MTGNNEPATAAFERARPRLWGLAYRMLGSAADADDAVQDTWLRWQAISQYEIKSPDAWLTTACSRLCIDMLRAAHRTRVDYVGPWLPEPVVGETAPEQEQAVELASSLSMAFMLLLERLTPAERAAYLLHDVFGHGYDDISAILGKKQEACRQLVSRARKRVGHGKAHVPKTHQDQRGLLDAFMSALRSGETDKLASLLAEDAELWTDGGGKVLAQSEVIHGRSEVSGVLATIWDAAWHEQEFEPVHVNGTLGMILRENGQIAAVLTLSEASDGQVSSIYVVRNPDKLARVAFVD